MLIRFDGTINKRFAMGGELEVMGHDMVFHTILNMIDTIWECAPDADIPKINGISSWQLEVTFKDYGPKRRITFFGSGSLPIVTMYDDGRIFGDSHDEYLDSFLYEINTSRLGWEEEKNYD